MQYSKSTNSFYSPEINTEIPDDAVEISYEVYQELLNGISTGKVLTSVGNNPTLKDPVVEEPTLSKEQAEQLRLIAYADPINGSDRYFAEALAMQAEGLAASSSEVKDTKARGVAKKAEIKALYPYPEDSE